MQEFNTIKRYLNAILLTRKWGYSMLTLENQYLKLGIKVLGAELVSVYHKELGKEMLWDGNPEYWDRTSPHLFPIVGKVFNNQYKVDGKTYEMRQHGFLRDQDFELVFKSENQVTLRYTSTDATYDLYPYKHAVEVTYILKDKRVEVIWNVINLDDKVMYYSIGAHPGFAIDKTHQYEVEYEVSGPTQQVILGNNYVKELVDVEVKTLVIEEDTFANDAVMYTGVDAVTLVDKTDGVRIRCDFKGFEYIAVWSSLNSGSMAPFICLEPWRGIVDDFGGFEDISQKRSIQSIEVGQEDVNTYGLEF